MKFLVDHTYIINRPDTECRDEIVLSNLDKANIEDYTIFETSDEKLRFRPSETLNIVEAEIAKATIEILKDAKEKGYRKILILHDDVMLTDNAVRELHKLCVNIDATTYDIVHLGHTNLSNRRIVEHGVVRIHCSSEAHSLIVNCRIFNDLIELLEKKDKTVEEVLMEKFHPQGRCFGIEPRVASRKPSYKYL